VCGDAYERDHRYTRIHGAGYGVAQGTPARTSETVSNTPDAYLFSTERCGVTNYMFDVPDGVYTVRLDFAETWFGGAGGVGVGGRTYYIHWVDDPKNSIWQNATPGGIYVPGDGPETWMDNGSGTGGIPPSQATSRFYRVGVRQ